MEKETFSEAVDLDGLQEIEEESKNNMDLKEQESTQQAQENIQNKDSDNMEASQSKESKEVETVFVNQSWQREEEEVAQRTEQDLAGSEEKGPKEMVEIYVHPSARADRAELTQRRSEVVNGTVSSPSSKDTILDWKRAVKAKEKEERDSLTVWSNPFYTYKYCYLECEEQLAKIPDFIKQHMIYAQIVVLLTSILAAIYLTPGPHQPLMSQLEKTVCWCLYWFGLGVLSSIGLGTGLHTFLLYLGPHIASVTLAAYECGGLNFPEPPYPDEIVCPTVVDPVWMTSLWTIMCKVWVEAVLWGAGTAFGELPPYFMARTARLSGFDPDDEDELKEFQEFQRKKEEHPELLTYADQMKIVVENLVAKMGFFGILACASIPNPLFDLAGITCGHFLVPFWTFFGATLIGKALIKMMIQQMFVIVAFNEVLIANAVSRLTLIPFIGHKLQGPVTEFFKQQKKRLHRKDPSIVEVEGNWISDAFDLFVFFMFLYFIVSIVHSLAQSYHKRLSKKIAQNLDVNTTPFALEENEELQEALESALDKKD